MEIETSKSMNQNLLSVLLETKEIKEDFRFRMLQTNCVENLLPVQRYYEGHQTRYLYDTTDKIAFSSLIKAQRLKEEEIRLLMETLFKALIRGKDYYLEEDSYLLVPDYIFFSKQEKTYYFCYCPDYCRPIRETVADLVSYFMEKVDYEDLEAVKLVYQLYQQVREESFSTKQLLAYLTKNNAYKDNKEDKRSIRTSTLQLEQQVQINGSSEFKNLNREEPILREEPVFEVKQGTSQQSVLPQENPSWIPAERRQEPPPILPAGYQKERIHKEKTEGLRGDLHPRGGNGPEKRYSDFCFGCPGTSYPVLSGIFQRVILYCSGKTVKY